MRGGYLLGYGYILRLWGVIVRCRGICRVCGGMCILYWVLYMYVYTKLVCF